MEKYSTEPFPPIDQARIMPATRDNSTRFSQATNECQRMASAFLDARISRLLAGAEKVFIDFAEKAESDKLQMQFIEAINVLKSSGNEIRNGFADSFKIGFDDIESLRNQRQEDRAADWGSLEEWSLVDNAELSENVVAMNIIEEAENSHFSELYALHQRFSLAAGGRVLEYERMPVGPHRIVSSFRHAILAASLDQKIRLVLYTLFRDYALKDLKEIYSSMNQTLQASGILPNLKRVVNKQEANTGTTKKEAVARAPVAGEAASVKPTTADEPKVAAVRSEPDNPGPPPSSDDLFQSIVTLMTLKIPKRWAAPRSHPGNVYAGEGTGKVAAGGAGSVARGSGSGGAAITSPSIVEAIDRIVQDGASSMVQEPIPDQRSAIALAQDTTFVERTMTSLAREREQIISSVPPQHMQPLDIQIIDIIGMLFEHMLNDNRLPNIAKAELSRLQTPYLKAALIDKQLLHDATHPGRRLLNILVESGEDFVNEQSPDWGIFPALRETVEEITRDFKDDTQLFARAYESLKPKVEAQKRKVSTLESRSKQIAQGRERFETYKAKASARIEEISSKHYVFQEVGDFLTNAWTDRLVFILLRDPDGESGEEWNRALEIAAFLAGLSVPPAQSGRDSIQVTDYEEIWREVDKDLSSLGGKPPPEWAPVAALLCNPKLLMQRMSAPIKHATDRAEAGPRNDSSQSGKTGDQAPIASSEQQASPQERDMVQALKSLEFGTWFEFFSELGGKPQRHKLSWHSSVTGKCMFVDRAGAKSMNADILWLAKEVLAQRARVVELDTEPFFERALKSILRMLKGSAKPKH